MTDLMIRNIDDTVMTALAVRAALHGRSIEEEACSILAQALPGAPVRLPRLPFGEQLRQQLAGLDAIDIPPRNPVRMSWRAGASRADP